MRGLIDKPTPSYIVGCEGRGFIFGSYRKKEWEQVLCVEKKVNFLPRGGKLAIKYGTDTLELNIVR